MRPWQRAESSRSSVPEGSDIQRTNFVGGASPAQRNVVFNGIRLVTGGNVIRNNYLGTNAAGTAALNSGNAGGISLSGNGNFIGGINPGEGNLISGTAVGIGIGNNFSNGGSNNTIQGNLIGTDATGQSAIPNTTAGLIISNFGNVIGGTAAGARNVISGNGLPTVPGPGLQLGGFSTFTGSALVQGNLIGVAADGTTPAAISGRVTLAANGAPLSNVTITLTSGATTVANTLTDANGNYSFANLATGDYNVTPSRMNYTFAPPSRNVVLNGTDAGGQDFAATPNAAPSAGGTTMLISELRCGGPTTAAADGFDTGDRNEFIELYNNSDQPFDISGFVLDTASGFSITIAPATVIPARGHFLVANSDGYSLNTYAAPDQTYNGADIPVGSGIALFNTTNGVVDAVGFGSTPSPYLESAALVAVTERVEYIYVRKLTTGRPQDTGDNAADFVLVSTAPESLASAPAVLGAPGPENLGSHIQRNATVKNLLIEPQAGSSAPPNRLRSGTPVAHGSQGTLSFRRRVRNMTGAPVTALRFRIVSITTKGSPGAGENQADLRAVDSSDVEVTTSDGVVTVLGTLVEQPPAQSANGGGLNSTFTKKPFAKGSGCPRIYSWGGSADSGNQVRFVVYIKQSRRETVCSRTIRTHRVIQFRKGHLPQRSLASERCDCCSPVVRRWYGVASPT
ncbi:MAG: carboxypeptidase regulatory-like domain-containing protein [Pyrinomonadaceae bacterium]